MALEIVIKHAKNIPILKLTGRVVDVDVKKFAKKLEAVAKTIAPRIAIDVSDVNFIDSHGLGILVYHHAALTKSGRALLILNTNTDPSTYVNRLFEMTHLNKVMLVVAELV